MLLNGSLMLYCASLLGTIFAPLARTHDRVRIQNVRDFPQAKFDGEINAPFLLNQLGDRYTLFHNFIENNILNDLDWKLADISRHLCFCFGK